MLLFSEITAVCSTLLWEEPEATMTHLQRPKEDVSREQVR